MSGERTLLIAAGSKWAPGERAVSVMESQVFQVGRQAWRVRLLCAAGRGPPDPDLDPFVSLMLVGVSHPLPAPALVHLPAAAS